MYFHIIWALPCVNESLGKCGQRRARSDCAEAQSDQGLCCPLPQSLNTLEYFNWAHWPGCDLAHAHINMDPRISRMLEGTFSLGAFHTLCHVSELCILFHHILHFLQILGHLNSPHFSLNSKTLTICCFNTAGWVANNWSRSDAAFDGLWSGSAVFTQGYLSQYLG